MYVSIHLHGPDGRQASVLWSGITWSTCVITDLTGMQTVGPQISDLRSIPQANKLQTEVAVIPMVYVDPHSAKTRSSLRSLIVDFVLYACATEEPGATVPLTCLLRKNA